MLVALVAVLPGHATAPDQAAGLAETYAKAVLKLNEEHRRAPAGRMEADLLPLLPAKALQALETLLDLEGDGVPAALLEAGRAALDLDRSDDFERIRARLATLDEAQARELGVALSRPRFLLLGAGGLELPYLAHFAEVLEAILGAYDEVFGFAEWSKVPGKKLRVRVHLEQRIERPPHFAPQFPFHSEIDFPVVDAQRLHSPTADGKFLYYGLCHELGHVIAMWGSPSDEEDHHAWAHYTGVAIVEHLAASKPACLQEARDEGWRSLTLERERLTGTAPSREGRDGVLALFLALHDAVGSRAIGAAVNHVDALDRRPRVNGVRYSALRDLEQGLLATLEDPPLKKAVSKLLD